VSGNASTSAAPGGDAAPLRAPASPGEILRVCTGLALQGFGGVLPVTQRVLVERERWLSQQEFVEMLALAQVLPGPNVINLGLMIGDRYFGWRGALAAIVGMMGAPLLVVLVLATLASHWRDLPVVGGALRGMGVVAAGLVASTAIKLAVTLRRNALGLPLALGIAALAAVAVGVLRWPLIGVVLGLGSAAVALAWWRLGRT
jgi:chromate transporter